MTPTEQAAEALRVALAFNHPDAKWDETRTCRGIMEAALARLTAEQPPVPPDPVPDAEAATSGVEGQGSAVARTGGATPPTGAPPVPPDRERLAKLMDLEADRAQALVMVPEAIEVATMKRQIAAVLRSPPVPPDRERLASELNVSAGILHMHPSEVYRLEQLCIEAAAALRSPADGFREGAEAMREACVSLLSGYANRSGQIARAVAAIRSLPIPSLP